MILGKITGKVNTKEFKFEVEKETKKFEYVQVYHKAYDYILCQIVEIEKKTDKTIAYCTIIGYKEDGKIKKPRIPFDPGTEVLKAEDDFIKEVIQLSDDSEGALIGKLDGKDIDVEIDLNRILTKHMAVLAKSGSGKSYSVGVLLEEMISREIPVLVIDPHGEYSSLKQKNTDEDELQKLAEFDLEPEGFNVEEYGDPDIKDGVTPLKLSNDLTTEEIVHMLPGNLTNTQLSLLYSSLKSLDSPGFDNLQLALETEESKSKWSVIRMVEFLRKQDIFSDAAPDYEDMIQPGKCSILNLRGIDPEVQEIIVYKITKDLFEMRKKNQIAPFFLVVEEAHNYCPERSFGETKSSKIFRTMASEGRKFGLGLCVVSQRPARVDKSVLSQCSTQFILKVTNPNDLKAISNSVEGITSSTSDEIQNLTIGTAMITGITEVPLFVDVRARKSMHGGTAEELVQEDKDFEDNAKDFAEKERLPCIKPFASLEDYALMNDIEQEDVKKTLIPCKYVTCENDEEFKILLEGIEGRLVTDKEEFETKIIPDMSSLAEDDVTYLKKLFVEKTMGYDAKFDGLKQKGYLREKDGKATLNESYVFNKLENYKLFEDIEYEEIEYDEKKGVKVSWADVMNKIKSFTTVKNKKDCYLVIYDD